MRCLSGGSTRIASAREQRLLVVREKRQRVCWLEVGVSLSEFMAISWVRFFGDATIAFKV